MMINLTVKTLDSRNHQFSVDDDMTVEQFKRHISDTVNIPADTQRIIYCGRVLQDSSKLNDYDVDGKVVHLVQRPPPGANTTPSSRSSRSSSPHPQRRVFRGLDHGNAMFLGSVAFPTNIMDTQNIVPPPPTHSHAGSRLNLARRMLRRAEHVISRLENPNGSADSTPVEDAQDEVTPVIEARVIVPSNSSEPLDEAAILSAVHDYSLLSGQNRRGQANSSSNGNSSTADATVPNTSAASESAGDSPPAPSADSSSATAFPENGTRTSAMADLLTLLSQLQIRFAPFLQRYHNFMRIDAVVSEEENASVQRELDRVSEVLHFLGHAYHSLSDIIIRVNIPPPRPLLCRPILIQHSVVQTGIPIQVEAQINLSNERPPNATSTQSTPGDETSPNHAASTTAPTATPQPFAAQAVPVISTVRVPIPLEIRGIVPPQGGNAPFVSSTASIINRDMVSAAMNVGLSAANAVVSSAAAAAAAAASASSTTAPTSHGSGGNTANGIAGNFGASNPEVEFIMEVTPEGITIDSLEAGIIGPNQADDLLRGALNGQQQPNLIQSIMQMAGQLINRRGSPPDSDPPPPNNSQQSSATSAPPLTPAPPTQNSQARGNNQTHPTSSTQTRSTARPHVHLQQQTMQVGFDPFLPCNSHHVSRRRTANAGFRQQATPTTNQRTEQEQFTTAAQDATTQLNSLMNSIVNSIRSSYQLRRPQGQSDQPSVATPSTAASQGAGEAAAHPTVDRTPSAPPAETVPTPSFVSANMAELMRNGPTLAEIFQQLPPDNSYVAGESIVRDFLMLLSRHLTIGDTVSLNGGNIAPLARITNEIQNFFMSSILNGSRNLTAIDSGVERILIELQPFLDALVQLPIRDDIDIEASVRRLIRARLPSIFLLSSRIADEPDNLRLLVDQFVAGVEELCALTLHACADGSLGVDQVFEIVATRFMQGIPADLQEFILMSSRTDFRRLMSNLNVPANAIELYIVRKTKTEDEQTAKEKDQEAGLATNEQPMETDEAVGTLENEASTSPSAKLEDYPESLPNVVIGSEAWHNQVPADWVPIIARDAQRQKKQHSQPPFSDAYLAGMPSKRRKIVHGTKGRQGLALPQIIAESVKRAVTATGLSSAAPLEIVAQAAGASTDIQAAYRGLLRSSVQEGLRNNDDFTPERFPHAANYFGGP